MMLILSWFMVISSLTRGLSNQLLRKTPLFKFGFIADTQYANIDDDYNFQRTKFRRHRQSLEILNAAVSVFNSEDVGFNILLGDTLDGKSALSKSQFQCLDDVFKHTKIQASAEFHYAFGNHEYYCFTRDELHKYLSPHFLQQRDQIGGSCSPTRLYYDFSPCEGWRFVMVDSYDVSLIGSSSEANKKQAESLLASKNPNDLSKSGGWFTNLPLQNYRYVPYNGGISLEQLGWFENVVKTSASRGEKMVMFSHQPVYAPAKPQSVIWNAEDILSILRKYGNAVLWMAGHDHDGQYAVDPMGMHHMVPPAPLECEYGQKAFGVMEVHDDELLMNWTGKLPLEPTDPWPTVMKYSCK
jgi:manganese-dependent ADP-ribose/CDP-alcohol diphosphatase